jgi:hypothetical protein
MLDVPRRFPREEFVVEVGLGTSSSMTTLANAA